MTKLSLSKLFVVSGILAGIGGGILLLILNSENQSQDQWKALAISGGFLSEKGTAIEKYLNCLSILRKHNIDSNDFEQKDNLKIDVPDAQRQWLIENFLVGARSTRLGIEIQPSGVVGYDMLAPSGKKLTARDFGLLAKAAEHFAYKFAAEKNRSKEPETIGKGLIALGLQLQQYDIDYILMTGLACKSTGLSVLQKCGKKHNDRDLLRTVEYLQTKAKEELKAIRELPAKTNLLEGL